MSEPLALRILKAGGYVYFKGIIRPTSDRPESAIETDAINYLCSEWDYSFQAWEEVSSD